MGYKEYMMKKELRDILENCCESYIMKDDGNIDQAISLISSYILSLVPEENNTVPYYRGWNACRKAMLERLK